MARRHGQLIPRKITMRDSLLQSVHVCLQQQVLGSIYVDGAIRTAAAKVMALMSQHAFELKCWGSATLG